jgi:iron complex outermembrane recepter protein
LTAGVRGVSHADWNWDLSYSVGHNRFHFFGEKTFNASFGAGQTNFDDGGFTNTQNTFNINGSKQADWLAGFNFGIGAEFRYERYTIFAGETASYRNYDPTGNKATGAQGFPGYQPGDEVKADRRVWGLYVDGELDITKQFLVNAAIRIEDYSDFGNTLNFKLASRYKVNDRMNIRGSVSTGFRAPSLQQINFSSTFTTVQGGTISEVKIAPNYSSITRAAGIPNLKQEEAFNASLGFTFKANNELNITIDGYLAKVKDRVVLSGQFSAGDPALDAGLKAELNRLKVGSAQFFANAVNTTNTGVDIVVEYNKKLAGEKSIRALLTGNIQSMTIDQINVPAKLKTAQSLIDGFYSDREQQFLLASAPPVKFGLTAEYNHNKKLNGGIRLTYFGKITTLGYGEDGLGVDPQVPTDADPTKYVPDQYDYPAKITTDLFASYKFFPEFTLFAGVDNVFNVHPAIAVQQAAKGWAFNNETGGPWDAVQMGGNGRRFFLRAALSF